MRYGESKIEVDIRGKCREIDMEILRQITRVSRGEGGGEAWIQKRRLVEEFWVDCLVRRGRWWWWWRIRWA